LGLIISDAAYAMIAPPTAGEPTVWETPNSPGRAPAETDGTAAQLSAAHHVWEEDVQTYRTCTSFQQALNNQIVCFFEPMYLEILNDNMVGYANISARDMLDHLFETYGNITSVNLEINVEHIRRAWDPQQPVETLFKQIQDCADYSEAGGVPIGPSQQINVGYAQIFATGHFMTACRRWNEKLAVDSRCTGHFLLVTAPCLNKVRSRNPLTVRLPNGATRESSHTADLDIPELNADAYKAHVFPGMAHHSLLSVGQLYDEGYIVTLRQDTVTICNSKSSELLSGPRDDTTGLWWINLKHANKHIPNPIANSVYELRYTGALIHYLNKALFSATKAAMLQEVKDGHLITWPGLAEEAINKHLKPTPATAMGHMNQQRQNIRSTSKASTEKTTTTG
jgi:hypothetical protein